MSAASKGIWGALARPVQQSLHDKTFAAWRDRYPWKDNLWTVFWDPVHEAYGMVWSTTSPNGAPRKTRAVVSLGGRTLSLLEEPPIGSLSSASIDVDGAFGEALMGGQPHRIAVDSRDIGLELTLSPRWRPLDYTRKHVLPPLGGAPELQHWQQGINVSGSLRVRGEETTFSGRGFRDRTWGWRSEGRQFTELYGGGFCFENFDMTLLKFLLADGSTVAGGYLQNEDAVYDIRDSRLLYNEMCLASSLDVDVDGLGTVAMNAGEVDAGWWMSFFARDTAPPVLCEYEMMTAWDAGVHGTGYGCLGHDVLRRLS